jgi:hypothetical protein
MKRLLISVALLIAAMGVAKAADADGDGVPNAAEKVLGTDPSQADTDGDGVNDLRDKDPVFAENTLLKPGKDDGFVLTGQVEDNIDEITKKSAEDHLELNIKNTSKSDLISLSAYYTINDEGTGKMEGYLIPLKGMMIASGKTAIVHFDDTKLSGHFRANPNSSYTRSIAAKVFSIEVTAAGFAPVKLVIKKDAGGAEQPD